MSVPDRLEEIVSRRTQDEDVRWLAGEILRLRDQVEREHSISLELAHVAVQKLNAVAVEVAAVADLLAGNRA